MTETISTSKNSVHPDGAGLHSPTVTDICRAAGISRRMFFNARTVQWAGCPELLRRVIDGEIAMNLALELVKFDHDAQRLIMGEFHDIPSRERLAFVRLVWDAHVKEVESDSPLRAENPAGTTEKPTGFAIGLPSHPDGICHSMPVPIITAGGRP